MFIIPLCLFLISTYLRPRTQAELSFLITAVECLSGLWCVLFAPFQIQIPLVGFLLIRNRKTIRSIWLGSPEEESYLDLSDQSTPTIDIEATPIETVSLKESVIDQESRSDKESTPQIDHQADQINQYSEQPFPVVTEVQEAVQEVEEASTSLEDSSHSDAVPLIQDIPRVVLAPFSHETSVLSFNSLSTQDRPSQLHQASIASLPGVSHNQSRNIFELQPPQSTNQNQFIQISF